MLKKIVGFVFISLLGTRTFSQVTVHINSGNPAFPFPQFLDYGTDRKSLASMNAPGVPHAEMEQKTRDAWQIFANSFVYSGEEWGGVKYIKGNVGCPYDCSEGDGYALIAAAAMGDKPTFDGLWMRTHDVRMVKHPRYRDGVVPRPDYKYGDNTLAEPGGDAATDGDFDIALGILMAWKQWGDNMGINDFSGKPISYKEAALNVMKGIVELKNSGLGDCRSVTGNVGFDGYVKNGNTWTEITNWATGRTPECPEYAGPQFQYVDYIAPAYLHAFGKVLEAENASAWDINQMKRAEASSDWIMGQAIKNPNGIPWAGNMSLDANGLNPTFSKFNEGEDFRMPWRTILNYVWHGNPATSWDPVTHQVINSPNTYEKDNAVRLAKFLSNPQGAPWNNGCDTYGGGPDLTYKGPSTLTWYSSPLGVKSTDGFTLNWIHGTGSPAAIGAQDFDLMGKMYRQCVIEWEPAGGTDNYLGSVPRYFHGWFRLLGMLVLAGNHHSPLNMVAKPNLKVYHKIDKTYGFTNDQVTYTLSYRNYGSVDATGAVVKFGLPAGFQFVSASNGGALSGDSVVWNLGTVKGFVTGGLAATMGSMTVTLKIGPNSSGRYCTNARISSTNGLGWVSNEYSNNITAVLERNCVDVIKRALKITKTADRKDFNPKQEVKYKIKFENSSDAGWLNGGRPGVTIGFARMKNMATPNKTNQNELKFRLYNDAVEPYIDYGNYRVSYFVNDPTIKCYYNPTSCPNGWNLMNTIKEGVNPDSVKAFQENIVEGSDALGSWNQRIVLQFSHQLATTTQHLSNYYGLGIRVHEGGTEPMRGVWRWFPNNYNDVDWTDDWSWDPDAGDDDGGLYYPVGDDYTDIFNPGRPITSWHTSACSTSSKIIKNVLVEEFDGYTWRRAFGNGPSPGRDLQNVVVRDTLPVGVTFKSFIKDKALGISATTSVVGGRTVVTWSIPAMQVNQKDSILFIATVGGSCPGSEGMIVNKAWISAQTESPIFDGDTINVTCSPVTICPTATTMSKKSDKLQYEPGQQVKYTIGYKQTQGSIVNPNLNVSTGWTVQPGSISNASFAANGITLPGMNNGQYIVLTHDNSYGLNTLGDGIEGTFQIQPSENNFAIVLRHTGGALANGVYINFKTDGGLNPTYVDIYSGTTKLNADDIQVEPGPIFDFRIQLKGGTLNMWLVPSGQPISGAPNIIQTGIPERLGYAGIAHGVVTGEDFYGSHRLVTWKAHMDVAYDAQIVDSIPSNITVDPASISNSGVLSSDAKAIIWTLASPMSYNDTITRTWSGTYKACQKTTNIAYVNTRGITGNQYGVCNEINCGTARVCVKPTRVTLNDTILEAGGTKTLRAFVTPPKADYIYNWYRVYPNNALKLLQTSASATYTTSDTGRFVVRVADIDTSDAQCYASSNIAKVTYGCSLPTVTVANATLTNSSATLQATLNPDRTGLVYNWYKLPDTATPLPNSGTDAKTLTVSDTGRYQVQIVDPSVTNCSQLSNQALVVSGCVPPVASITTTPLSYCANTKSMTLTAQLVAGMDYQWFKRGLAVGINSNILTNADSGVYTVRVGQGTCTATSLPVTVVAKAQPLAEIDPLSKLTYCVGSTWSLDARDAGTGATYWWVGNDIPQGSASTSKTFSPSTVFASPSSWKVITSLDGCSDTSAAVTVTEVQSDSAQIEIQADRSDACIGTLVNVVVVDRKGETIQWFKDGVEQTGETGISYSFTFAQDTEIKVRITSTESCFDPKVDSSIVLIKKNVEEAVLDLVVSPLLPVCEGQSLTFTAKTTSGVPSPGYVWTVNDQPATATDDSLLITTTLKNGDVVKVSTTDACTPTKEVTDNMTVQLTQVVIPSVSLKQMGAETCDGQSVTFKVDQQSGQGTSPGYTWFVNGNPQSQSPTESDSLPLVITAKTEVYVKLTSAQACASPAEVSSDPVTLDVTQAVTPFVEIAMVKVTPCPDDNTVVFSISDRNGEGNAPIYKWYLNGDSVATGETYTTSSLAQGDNVKATLTSDLECAVIKTVESNTITYWPAEPLVLSLYNNVNHVYKGCVLKGDPTTFDVLYTPAEISPISFEWYVNSELKEGENKNFISLSTLSDGDTLLVKAVVPGCISLNVQDWMVVPVEDKPLEGFRGVNSDINLCEGSVKVISNESNPAYTAIWKKDRQEIARGYELEITQPGQYFLEITNKLCPVTSSVRVRKPTLNVKAIADPINFVPGDPVKLEAVLNNPNALTNLVFSWTPKALIQPSEVQQTSFYPQETMWVKVRVTAGGGCSSEDSIQIFKTDRLFVPNAITPETGDQNAFWNIRGTEAYPELEVRVFNRWGSLVHEQKGYSTPWDGTLNGKPLPTGTYYYVLKDKKFDQPKVGDLTLVR